MRNVPHGSIQAAVRGAVITANTESFEKAQSIITHLGKSSEIVNGLLEVLDHPVDLGKSIAKLFCIKTECLATGGTCHLSVSLEPTDLLRDFLRTSGARYV